MLNIIYPYTNLSFPSKMANMIQTLNTCYALAKSDRVTIHFILRNHKRWSVKEILEYYGLKEHPNLYIHSITIPYIPLPVVGVVSNIFFKFNLYLKTIDLVRNYPNSLVYARDINVLSLLVRVRKLFDVKIAYEAHSIQAWFFKNWHTWHGSDRPFPKWKAKWYAYKENRVLRKADFIVAVTRRLRDVLVEEFRIEGSKIFVIPDATKLTPLDKPIPAVENGKKVIGYAGQLNTSRGVDVLIEAIMYLDNIEVELLVVGGSNDGKDLERLKKLAEKLDLIDRITFTGYVKPSEITHYLLKSDVLVLPLLDHIHSTNFASSLKQFDYMASKRPIVATNLLSTREVLKDGENAILVEPSNAMALAKAIKKVLENKELASRIAENAYKEVCEKYTWEKRSEKILSVINGSF